MSTAAMRQFCALQTVGVVSGNTTEFVQSCSNTCCLILVRVASSLNSSPDSRLGLTVLLSTAAFVAPFT
jgi:hypothetical protein